MTMHHARFTVFGLSFALVLGALAAADENAPIETATTQQSLQPVSATSRQAVQDRLIRLKQIAMEAAKALPEGETKVLRAVVMELTGKVQWRQESTGTWKAAAKDDIMKPGAMIRTGLRSWMMLRIGINANVLVDSGSRVVLPQIVHAGDTLKTTVQIKRGRADVEVGHVGLTNDFSVLTPSGALAVRGTGMAVSHSAMQGTQVFGARTNAMNAIAMKYYGSKVAHMMSGDAISTQQAPNPAVAEALETTGPAPLNASEAQDQQDSPDQTSQAISNSDPINQSVRELLAEQQEAINEEILEEEFGDPFIQDGFSWYVGENGVVLPEDMGAVATGLYWDMKLQHVPTHVDP
ncbi:MAG: FecR domain-containing protein, partial [Phycisphaerales bacterium]|nr:FecR domain-containing protein [Phycisphaerales bacterium]